MKWPVLVLRTLLGLVFFVLGLDYFLNLTGMKPPMMPAIAQGYLAALGGTHYMTAIKVLEITGGFLLLTGQYPCLGVTIITPIAVNILCFEVFLLGQPGLGVALVAICLLLVVGYWRHFKPVFVGRPAIGF